MSKRRWARRITVAVAAVAVLATSSCLGGSVKVIDIFTYVPTGTTHCVTANSTLFSTLGPGGTVAVNAITQSRKGGTCATPEVGIGLWDYLRGQVLLQRYDGTGWTLCSTSTVVTTTTAQFVLPGVSHQCGSGTYRALGKHWTEVSGYDSYGTTTSPAGYFAI